MAIEPLAETASSAWFGSAALLRSPEKRPALPGTCLGSQSSCVRFALLTRGRCLVLAGADSDLLSMQFDDLQLETLCGFEIMLTQQAQRPVSTARESNYAHQRRSCAGFDVGDDWRVVLQTRGGTL